MLDTDILSEQRFHFILLFTFCLPGQNMKEHILYARVCGLADRARLNDSILSQSNLFTNRPERSDVDGLWSIRARCKASLPFWQVNPVIHVYRCKNRDSPWKEPSLVSSQIDSEKTIEKQEGCDGIFDESSAQLAQDGSPSDLMAVINLPSVELEGLWESIILDSHQKAYLLEYIGSAFYFSQRAVDMKLIACNRVVLLHGPPGTGKSTICRGLAQKLSIRLDSMNAKLIEIHANNLFSKWFSESSRNVFGVFREIRRLAMKSELVVVVIDEVESLSVSRNAGISKTEPSDSLRAVNALLTSLDMLQSCPNVIILATSNVTDAIDGAFLDRADIKQFIGPPTLSARYDILRSGVNELIRRGVVLGASQVEDNASSAGKNADFSTRNSLSSKNTLEKMPAAHASKPTVSTGSSLIGSMPSQEGTYTVDHNAEQVLLDCADATAGLSGRTLKKLCLLAHATFFGDVVSPVSLVQFLAALKCVALSEQGSTMPNKGEEPK